jgi:hypothetical protein
MTSARLLRRSGLGVIEIIEIIVNLSNLSNLSEAGGGNSRLVTHPFAFRFQCNADEFGAGEIGENNK